MNQLSIPKASIVIGKVNVAGDLYFESLGVDQLDIFPDRLEKEIGGVRPSKVDHSSG